MYAISANAAVDTIIELEPLMEEDSSDRLILEFQKDEFGESGDVRAIVIRRDDINWEIGLSIKHNHDAVKHSRLSHVLDFGKEWYGVPCSDYYWNDIDPVFDLLKHGKSRKAAWSARRTASPTLPPSIASCPVSRQSRISSSFYSDRYQNSEKLLQQLLFSF